MFKTGEELIARISGECGRRTGFDSAGKNVGGLELLRSPIGKVTDGGRSARCVAELTYPELARYPIGVGELAARCLPDPTTVEQFCQIGQRRVDGKLNPGNYRHICERVSLQYVSHC